MNMEELTKRIELIEAKEAITKIMTHYEVVHTPDLMYRTADETFALWRDDCTMEVSDWGVWKGPDAVKYLFEIVMKEDQIGTIMQHHLETPYIEVGSDMQTAKATFWSTGFETVFSPDHVPEGMGSCTWSWGKYAADFIKNPETGEWRIWHLKWFRTLRCNYYRNWVDDEKYMLKGTATGLTGKVKPEHPGLQPMTMHRPYTSTGLNHPFPLPPQPYDEYDGSFRWWLGDKELQARYDINVD